MKLSQLIQRSPCDMVTTKRPPTQIPPAEIVRTGHNFLSRICRIIAGGQPLMLINEKFPVEGHYAIRTLA